jgi:hypothetical protein
MTPQMERRITMVCDNYQKAENHTEKATHRIGVGAGEKYRVCQTCYDAIIADAIAGKVRIWDCN